MNTGFRIERVYQTDDNALGCELTNNTDYEVTIVATVQISGAEIETEGVRVADHLVRFVCSCSDFTYVHESTMLLRLPVVLGEPNMDLQWIH